MRPTVTAAFVFVVFAILNVANLCGSSWCDRRGFPFTYRSWSDAQVVMNGENLGVVPFSATPLLADTFIGLVTVATTYMLARRFESAAPN